MPIDFTKKLLKWNRSQNKRMMPWKGEINPYRIWLSEIILQQTRVVQGTVYYEKFISAFPTLLDLANASEREVFKYWEGLGYYSRCRNLIAAAKQIVAEYRGNFPSSYSEILSLPGVGPYTAAAIASFAFKLPYAVVDGNVERVLARYFGITTPTSSAAGKNLYNSIASELLNTKHPAVYNQAIMDFGATICKPQNPLCNQCVQSANCQAYKYGWAGRLPVKRSSAPRKKRWLYYFIVHSGKDRIWIRKRTQNDIWQNLYEFVLWETGKIIPHDEIRRSVFFRSHFEEQGFQIRYISPVFSQTLTHQSITSSFIHIDNTMLKLSGYQSASLKELQDYPFPKLLADYIKNLRLADLW
jgi:A/G-specific adenine glycosylase